MTEKTAVLILFISSIIGGALFGYTTSEIKNNSGIENLKKFQPNIPTKLYDVDGELIAELFQEKRELISFEELPKNLINAFLATEDRDFYKHFGVNPIAIFRAFLKNIAAGKVVQGGSTITQQLSKRLFTRSERTLKRKILETIIALQIEKKFSKEEILEMYFNQIYLGHGCYGISSAANLFFNKDVKHLNLEESAVLAALPSAPTRYSPFQNPHNAYEKNRDILTRMVNAGFISDERAKKIYNEFWPTFIESIKLDFPTKTAHTRISDNAPYFTDYIRRILLSRFGKEIVYNEGLSVYTTLSLKRQKYGQKFLTEALAKQNEISSKSNRYSSETVDKELFRVYKSLRNIFNLPEPVVKDDIEAIFNKLMVDELANTLDIITLLTGAEACNYALDKFRAQTTGISSTLKVEGALVAIEPPTGYITTMIGGTGFSVDNQYNRAIQARRQVGSAFKPFVYGAGIDSKLINAGTTLPDAPIVNMDADGETWSPGNYKDKFSGMVRLREALARSINIISVRIYDIIGPEVITDYATNMLRVPDSRFTQNAALSLGVCELTPFEMARGYAIYANRGRDVIPFAIKYVIDRDGKELANIEEDVGNILAEKEIDESIQVIPEEVAYILSSMLQDVVKNGTATRAIRTNAEFNKSCAGKTGTTSNWTDAWFCGFTPDLTSVVWVGYDRPFMSLGKHQAGSIAAAPIWANYMKNAYNSMKDPVFPQAPPGLYRAEICRYTGLFPSDNCDDIVIELMLRDGGVTEICEGNHYKMKSILDTYIEKEGIDINQ